MKDKKINVIATIIISSLILFYIFNLNFGINRTKSLPLGIYMYSNSNNLKKGDIVVFNISDKWKNLTVLRNIKNVKIRFMKQIAADSNDKLEIRNNHLYVNGEDYGEYVNGIEKADLKISKGKFWVLSKEKNSLDSRYYGEISKDQIEKKAKLIYEFKRKNVASENK